MAESTSQGSTSSDLYAILEVKKTSQIDELRRSYQRLAKQVLTNSINS